MKKKDEIFLLTAVLVILIDQVSKICTTGRHAEVIKNFFSINYIENTGVGFGLFKGSNAVVIFLVIIFIFALIYYYKQIPNEKNLFLYTGLLLGGAIGNLVDRIVLGFVRDFIDFSFWPAFNVADIVITAGGIGIIIYLMKKK